MKVLVAATLRSGASINVPLDTIPVHGNLKIDNRMELDVPSQIAGNGYLPVNGTTHVLIENTALPSIQPARLLVSDYPERLTANGVLFTARLDRRLLLCLALGTFVSNLGEKIRPAAVTKGITMILTLNELEDVAEVQAVHPTLAAALADGFAQAAP